MSSTKLITVTLSSLFLLIVAISLRSADLCLMSTALISVPVLSYVVGRIATRTLRCSRESPMYAHEGQPIQITLRVDGKSNLLGAITLDDRLPQWIQKNDGHPIIAESTPDETVASYEVTGMKRGEYTVGPLILHTSDPLGFFQFRSTYSLTSNLIVLPQPLGVQGLRMWSAGGFGDRQFEGEGSRGSGTEFHGVREYQVGDELRRVHWRSTAKHGELNVIEFEHSRARDAVIAVDLQRGTESGRGRFTSLEYAIRMAAWIADEMIASGGTVRLVCGGLGGQASIPGRGSEHLHVILDALARIEANRREPLSEVLLADLDSFVRGSDVVCLSSTIDAGIPRCAELLLSKGARLHFIVITVGNILPDETELIARQLAASDSTVTVVGCSRESVDAHVVTDYAN